MELKAEISQWAATQSTQMTLNLLDLTSINILARRIYLTLPRTSSQYCLKIDLCKVATKMHDLDRYSKQDLFRNSLRSKCAYNGMAFLNLHSTDCN